MAQNAADTGGKSQADKFIETARALECDEDEDAFKAKLRKVATAPKLDRSLGDKSS